mgnify:CR=1 FL=1
MKKQIIKVVASKDFKFFHIDAGLDAAGLQRIITETSEESIAHHILQRSLEDLVFREFPELRREAAIEVHITWV